MQVAYIPYNETWWERLISRFSRKPASYHIPFTWIPCNMALPQSCNQVLITIHWSKFNDYEVTLGEYWGEPEGWGNLKVGDNQGTVVAWAALPDPYIENYKTASIETPKEETWISIKN